MKRVKLYEEFVGLVAEELRFYNMKQFKKYLAGLKKKPKEDQRFVIDGMPFPRVYAMKMAAELGLDWAEGEGAKGNSKEEKADEKKEEKALMKFANKVANDITDEYYEYFDEGFLDEDDFSTEEMFSYLKSYAKDNDMSYEEVIKDWNWKDYKDELGLRVGDIDDLRDERDERDDEEDEEDEDY